jgi:hypothetical protein
MQHKEPRAVLLSKTEYSKHVKLSPGRITQLLAKGLPTVAGKIDPDAADAWIEANIDHDRRERERERQAGGVINEPAPVRVETNEARRQKMQADAGLAKFKLQERAGSLVPREAAENCKRRLFPILLRGLSTVEDLRFSALLRQIERSRGNGTIERNAGGERRCRQACKTHSFREPGMA